MTVMSASQAVSATRRGDADARSGYGLGSPLLKRAQCSSRGPAEMEPVRPSAAIQSSDNVRGDRPPSTVAMMTGHAARVDSKRASTLFEGISRSEYPTAPSMPISIFSPGFRRNRLGTALVKSNSGISRSSSASSFVFMSFALHGAPCGDDPRPWARKRDYHDQKSTSRRPGRDLDPRISVRMIDVSFLECERAEKGLLSFNERDSVHAGIDRLLGLVPVVSRHPGTLVADLYRAVIP